MQTFSFPGLASCEGFIRDKICHPTLERLIFVVNMNKQILATAAEVTINIPVSLKTTLHHYQLIAVVALEKNANHNVLSVNIRLHCSLVNLSV